jgi:hypothetical protein
MSSGKIRNGSNFVVRHGIGISVRHNLSYDTICRTSKNAVSCKYPLILVFVCRVVWLEMPYDTIFTNSSRNWSDRRTGSWPVVLFLFIPRSIKSSFVLQNQGPVTVRVNISPASLQLLHGLIESGKPKKTKQRSVFNSKFAPSMNLAPRGEIWFLGVNFDFYLRVNFDS